MKSNSPLRFYGSPDSSNDCAILGNTFPSLYHADNSRMSYHPCVLFMWDLILVSNQIEHVGATVMSLTHGIKSKNLQLQQYYTNINPYFNTMHSKWSNNIFNLSWMKGVIVSINNLKHSGLQELQWHQIQRRHATNDCYCLHSCSRVHTFWI